jgi:hypothetical protein
LLAEEDNGNITDHQTSPEPTNGDANWGPPRDDNFRDAALLAFLLAFLAILAAISVGVELSV